MNIYQCSKVRYNNDTYYPQKPPPPFLASGTFERIPKLITEFSDKLKMPKVNLNSHHKYVPDLNAIFF